MDTYPTFHQLQDDTYAPFEFSDVRQLMQLGELDEKARRRLVCAVECLHEQDPAAYFDTILPYMRSFPHHFEQELYTCQGNLIQLESYAKIMPFAWFGLQRSAYRGGAEFISALKRAGCTRRFRSIALVKNGLWDDSVDALVGMSFDGLRALDLSGNRIWHELGDPIELELASLTDVV